MFRRSVRGLVAGVVLALGVGMIAPYGQVAQATELTADGVDSLIPSPFITGVSFSPVGDSLLLSVFPSVPKDVLPDDYELNGWCVDDYCMAHEYQAFWRANGSSWASLDCEIVSGKGKTPWRVCEAPAGVSGFEVSVQSAFRKFDGALGLSELSSPVQVSVEPGGFGFSVGPDDETFRFWGAVLGAPKPELFGELVAKLSAQGQWGRESAHDSLPALRVDGADESKSVPHVLWHKDLDNGGKGNILEVRKLDDSGVWSSWNLALSSNGVCKADGARRILETWDEAGAVEWVRNGIRQNHMAVSGLLYLLGVFARERLRLLNSVDDSVALSAVLGSVPTVVDASQFRSVLSVDELRGAADAVMELQNQLAKSGDALELKSEYKQAIESSPIFDELISALRTDPGFLASVNVNDAAVAEMAESARSGDLSSFQVIANWVIDHQATVDAAEGSVKEAWEEYLDDEIKYSLLDNESEGVADEIPVTHNTWRNAVTAFTRRPNDGGALSALGAFSSLASANHARLESRNSIMGGSSQSRLSQGDNDSVSDEEGGGDLVLPTSQDLNASLTNTPGYLTVRYRPLVQDRARGVGEVVRTWLDYRAVPRAIGSLVSSSLLNSQWSSVDLHADVPSGTFPTTGPVYRYIPITSLTVPVGVPIEVRIRQEYRTSGVVAQRSGLSRLFSGAQELIRRPTEVSVTNVVSLAGGTMPLFPSRMADVTLLLDRDHLPEDGTPYNQALAYFSARIPVGTYAGVPHFSLYEVSSNDDNFHAAPRSIPIVPGSVTRVSSDNPDVFDTFEFAVALSDIQNVQQDPALTGRSKTPGVPGGNIFLGFVVASDRGVVDSSARLMIVKENTAHMELPLPIPMRFEPDQARAVELPSIARRDEVADLVSVEYATTANRDIQVTVDLRRIPDSAPSYDVAVQALNPANGRWETIRLASQVPTAYQSNGSNWDDAYGSGLYQIRMTLPSQIVNRYLTRGENGDIVQLRTGVRVTLQRYREEEFVTRYSEDGYPVGWRIADADELSLATRTDDPVPVFYPTFVGVATPVLHPLVNRASAPNRSRWNSHSELQHIRLLNRIHGSNDLGSRPPRLLLEDSLPSVSGTPGMASVSNHFGRSISKNHFDTHGIQEIGESVPEGEIVEGLFRDISVVEMHGAVLSAGKLFISTGAERKLISASLHRVVDDYDMNECPGLTSGDKFEFRVKKPYYSDVISSVSVVVAPGPGLPMVDGSVKGSSPVLAGAPRTFLLPGGRETVFIPIKDDSSLTRVWWKDESGDRWSLCANYLDTEYAFSSGLPGYAACSGLTQQSGDRVFRVQSFAKSSAGEAGTWGPLSAPVNQGDVFLSEQFASALVLNGVSVAESNGDIRQVAEVAPDGQSVLKGDPKSVKRVTGAQVSWRGGVGPYLVEVMDSTGKIVRCETDAGAVTGVVFGNSALCIGLTPGFNYSFRVTDAWALNVPSYVGDMKTKWSTPLCMTLGSSKCFEDRGLSGEDKTVRQPDVLAAPDKLNAVGGLNDIKATMVWTGDAGRSLATHGELTCVREDGQSSSWDISLNMETRFAVAPGLYECGGIVVREFDGARSGRMSASNAVAVGPAPSIPANIAVGQKDRAVVASWDDSTVHGPGTEPTFLGQYREVGAPLWSSGSKVNWSQTGVRSLALPYDLPSNTDYEIRVRAESLTGTSAWSVPVKFRTPPGVPHVPLSVSAVLQGSGDSVAVSWSVPRNDGGAPLSGYQVSCVAEARQVTEWSENQDAPWWWWIAPGFADYVTKEKLAAVVNTSDVSRSVVVKLPDLDRGSYECSVSARNSYGLSVGSDPVEVLLPGVGPVSFRVSRLTGALFGNLASFKWDHVKGAEDYRLYFRKAGSLTWREEPTAIAGDKWPGSNNIVKSFGRGYEFMVTAVVDGRETRPSSTARL